MNLLYASFIVRRGLAAVLSIGAAFFGYHMINKAESASVDHSIATHQQAYEKSTANVTAKRSGNKLEVTGANGTKVTVKGLPTAGR